MLTSSLVAAVIGTQLPKVGGIYLSQTFQYIALVRIGDVITARVEVMEQFMPGVASDCSASVSAMAFRFLRARHG